METQRDYELRILEKSLQRQKMMAEFEEKYNIQGETVEEKLEAVEDKKTDSKNG